VVARDLIDVPRIRRAVRASSGDALAFVGTLVGTWSLSLDQAILLGVGISLVLFLRRARLLVVRELVMGPEGRLREAPLVREPDPSQSCVAVRVLHIEGPLFFGAAGELQAALDELAGAPGLEVLVVRMKRTQGLDATTLEVLESTSLRLREQGQALLLVGLRPDELAILERTGAAERLGADQLFPTRPTWFRAMDEALAWTRARVGEHSCVACPLAQLGPVSEDDS
jgi:SulP family sulfate permease